LLDAQTERYVISSTTISNICAQINVRLEPRRSLFQLLLYTIGGARTVADGGGLGHHIIQRSDLPSEN